MSSPARTKQHWAQVYATKSPGSVSWYQPHARVSMCLIRETGIEPAASIIDVGGGASNLVDDLLADGFQDVTVLDVSGAALDAARRRLGARASSVRWIEADLSEAALATHAYDLWHDRATFHFLGDPADRAAYTQTVLRTVKPGGHVIVATFAEDGPARCSGLPVTRYSATELHPEFGASFSLLRHEHETHVTPSGAVQSFVYCLFRKVAP